MAADLKLLSKWYSPFSLRVTLALNLKGLKFENLPQDLSNKSKLLLDSNPVYKKIPVLLHNGKAIAESAIILQYIDELWPHPNPLLPKDPFVRARHRFWGDFIDKKIFVPLQDLLWGRQERAELNKELIANLIILEGALAELRGSDEGAFFGGANISFLDVIFIANIQFILGLEAEKGLKLPSQEECPRLHKLLAAVAEHPVCIQSLPPLDKLKEIIRNVIIV